MTATIETREFQAEARQLLDLMIHSVYSEKDIFLRELISNASDALDKLRLEALLHDQGGFDTSDLHIFLEADKEKRTLTVRDNGIGMGREEVVNLIGTIAKSGTRDFLNQMKDSSQSADLIGQFGVGFYSSFMVAERVSLESRRAGQDQGVRWESSGDGTYTIETIDLEETGTSITLHLKPADPENGLHDYTSPWKLREIVKRYSDFIAYPIRMNMERQETPEGSKEPKLVLELETLNSMKALWTRPKEEVTPEEYAQFYKHISHDWTDPWETMAMKGEGTFEYHSLLFIPERAPFDLFMQDSKRGLQLYVRKVFIVDDCEELMPPYLRFVRGVVDAQDLPLNISREMLQKDRHIEMIRRRLVKKVLDTLKEIKESDSARYQKFWKEFGRVLKEGLYHEGGKNRDALLELCLFRSTRGEEPTTLGEYRERMAADQDVIYYLTGENIQSVERSPHLESFKARGIEVLILTDPVDEIWLGSVTEFQEKKLQSVARGEVQLGSEEERKQAEQAREQQNKENASFLLWLSSKLEGVKEARVSSRLTESACCLVGDAHDMSSHMEKLMRAMGQEVPRTHRILEINPEHGLIRKLRGAYEAKQDAPELEPMARLLYGMAVLAEGGELEQPADFSRELAGVLERALES